MKKEFSVLITFTFLSALVCFFCAGTCAAQDKGITKEDTISDQPVYSVPAEKAQRWEEIQKTVKQDHHVCTEHCGSESDCLNKCMKAYKSRIEREYQQLMYK